MRIGLYPGTFDPITLGHIDIIQRAAMLVDRLVIGVTINRDKGPLFTLEERVALIEAECAVLSVKTGTEIVAHPFENLLIDCAHDVGATMIIRGLRAVSDFEYEFQMTGMNSRLDSDIETSTIVANIPVTVANASLVGDTFQVDVVINADGTFTAGGQYRVVSTITPVGTPAITESEIIIFEPSPGSYTLDSIENTITFMSQDAGLLEGTFNVIVFNETTFTLNQQIEETMGDLTVKANVNLSLERK